MKRTTVRLHTAQNGIKVKLFNHHQFGPVVCYNKDGCQMTLGIKDHKARIRADLAA